MKNRIWRFDHNMQPIEPVEDADFTSLPQVGKCCNMVLNGGKFDFGFTYTFQRQEQRGDVRYVAVLDCMDISTKQLYPTIIQEELIHVKKQ